MMNMVDLFNRVVRDELDHAKVVNELEYLTMLSKWIGTMKNAELQVLEADESLARLVSRCLNCEKFDDDLKDDVLKMEVYKSCMTLLESQIINDLQDCCIRLSEACWKISIPFNPSGM